MNKTICFCILLLVSLAFSCSKKDAVDVSAPVKEITVNSGMDYYVEQTQGKWVWQVYLEFDQNVTNASGNATVEFVSYKRKKENKKQTIKLDWIIPSTTNSKNFVFNTNWTTYDFDDVDSINLKSFNCTSGNYHFKIK
jgi:hypothetical protein